MLTVLMYTLGVVLFVIGVILIILVLALAWIQRKLVGSDDS